jgi:hypothetical protein
VIAANEPLSRTSELDAMEEITIMGLRTKSGVMTYQQQRRQDEETLGDRGGHLRKCEVTTKPKHIATACIGIRGFPPDNGDEPVSVVNSYADWFSRRPA